MVCAGYNNRMLYFYSFAFMYEGNKSRVDFMHLDWGIILYSVMKIKASVLGFQKNPLTVIT